MPDIENVIRLQDHPTSTVDLLQDYWADYCYFRNEAWNSVRHGDQLRTHRYLRSGLGTFLNYLTGLTNRWELSQGLAFDIENLSDRLVFFAFRFQASPPPTAEVEALVSLAWRLANVQPADETNLLQSLEIEPIDANEQRILSWLDELTRVSGLIRPQEVPVASDLNSVTDESYQDFEALKNDPLAFQDPLDTWEEIGPALDRE